MYELILTQKYNNSIHTTLLFGNTSDAVTYLESFLNLSEDVVKGLIDGTLATAKHPDFDIKFDLILP